MTTALAAQLAQIATSSKSSLDVKAQKAAHSKSLIFEPRVAASQNFQTLYSICHEGFEDLCNLDPRFTYFGKTIFSEQSQNEDRTQMTAAENAELDKKIDSFLRLVGARLRLMPAIKAIEWLVRRFRIHEHNTSVLISTFLPYHTIPAFTTLLSILPSDLPPVYKFIAPYARSLTQLPRAVIVHQAIHHPELLTTISTYTLDCSKAQQHYPALVSFWGGITTEAVSGMLDLMRSGRRNIQKSNDQTLLHRIGPILSDALVLDKAPDLQIACYMVLAVFVAKGDLEDGAISALMEQLVTGWSTDSLRPGLVCLSILAHYRSAKQLSGRVTRALLKVQGLPQLLVDIGKDHNIGKLANGLCLSLVDRLSRKGDVKGLPVVESILSQQFLNEQQTAVLFKSLLLAAHKIDDQVDPQGLARKVLASTIIGLTRTEASAREIFTKVIADTDVDVDALELRLDAEIRPRAIARHPSEDVVMNDSEGELTNAEDFSTALQRVGALQTKSTDSCLQSFRSDIFVDLCAVYVASLSRPEDAAAFEQISPLQRDQANTTPYYLSFFMRIWSGPYPTLARVGALETTKDRLKQGDCAGIDFQAILPYCIIALNDASRKVRRAAADLLIVVQGLSESVDSKSDSPLRWGHDRMYDDMKSVAWLSPEVSRKLIHTILVPSLEECVLNADHVLAVVQNALASSSSRTSLDGAEKDKKHHLSHGTRLSILTFLASHVVHTPLLVVKLRLLTPMNKIKSISGTSRTQLLLPLLEWWSSLSAEDAKRSCAQEKVDELAIDQSSVEVILPNDKAGLEFLLGIVDTGKLDTRLGLLHAVFARIHDMWSSMKTETKHVVAHHMLDLAQKGWSEDLSPASSEAADLLKGVELNTDILLFFLESLEPTAKMATEPSPNKRRRTSSSEAHRGISTQATPELASALKQVTFVLQLVEGSNPENHPQLLNALFNTLSELQHFRALVGSELGYLQNLVLRSLLAMVPAYKNSDELKIDRSGGHGDLLVNCIQKSSSPAVQSSALLLVASLANVAPELILHSVMPIFTFMGSSVLRQNDDYSAHVINQTVKEVVPPLIKSLLKGKRDPVAGASELLLSFVTAYEHIPSHRRLGLFISLVETLDPDKFLFAVLAMLADKYGMTDQVLSFSTELFNHFNIETQLQSLVSIIGLIADIFKPKPGLSSVLLGTNEDGERDSQKIALRQLNLLPPILSSRKLMAQVSKLAERDDMEASKVRELYSTLLENLLGLADSLKSHKSLYSRCGDAVSKLLNLLSIGEFIKAVETLLDRPDPVLRRKVLRAVEMRIDQESQANANSRTALLAFLPQLTAIIRVSDDMLYKHIAVGCVDKIAEKYGKKDPEAVTAAAATIAGKQCLGQDDERLRVMALLCLASLVDVLQDGVVPVLPSAIPKTLSYITESLQASNPHAELHNAGYAFLTALAQHLPYILSGSYLQQLLAVSSVSAKTNLSTEANDARLQCLNFLAKQIDAKVMFSALEQNWSTASGSGFTATREYLDTLGLAIDKHKKNVVEKNVNTLSAIFLNMFDLRRQERLKADAGGGEAMKNINRIEELVNGAALRMIYKLNDAAFRPIFIRLMEWASTGLPKKDATGRTLRQLSVFGFLLSFFDALKSIVTGYASYMTDVAVGILNSAAASAGGFASNEERELWRKTLHTLTKCFEHDQDDFWQAPAHFDAVAPALISQFALLGTLSSSETATSTATTAAATEQLATQDLIPAVVELARAADSGEHQKSLNGALLRHLRSERAGTRLAAVRCEQALTARLGEEWLAMLPEMLPYISELQEDDDEDVERETHRWIVGVEGVLGESLDAMLQ
ncbi:snoRNA-binding rRNA-processing protein utp10 [Diatrype stigma]|uniref:U3 small nucleolar RNA-associated protein 10 n=1 Tax=Diatrype stigma TaxID=117547 RepID=A0AAN9UKN2_9PEZI